MNHREEDIVECLRRSDVKCVKMLFDNYYQLLCVFALRFLHSFEDAEDVVQDVFVAFWEKRKGRPFDGSLKSYLFGAVQKGALYHERSAGHMVFEGIDLHVNRLVEEASEMREEDMLARKEKLDAEIRKLPEKCREVFTAIVLEGLSYKEVAEKLDVSVNTVKTHYSRALKQLRDNLDTIVLLFLFFQEEGNRAERCREMLSGVGTCRDHVD